VSVSWIRMSPLVFLGLIFFGGATSTQASTVKLDFVNVTIGGSTFSGNNVKYSKNSGTSTTGVKAGQYNWTIDTGGDSNLFGPVGSAVKTFCIDLSQTAVSNTLYTITADISNLPVPVGPPMGPAKAQKIAYLAHKTFTAAYAHDQLQAAIWNIVYETSAAANAYKTNDGVFRVNASNQSSPLSGATAFAIAVNSILADVELNYAAFNLANADQYVLGLKSYSGQDQIVFVTEPQWLTEAPVPAGLALAGMGMMCLGAVQLIRRRKLQVS
jgi:hypothetical protein